MSEFVIVAILDQRPVMALGLWTVDQFYKPDGGRWSGWLWASQSITNFRSAGYVQSQTLRGYESDFGVLENLTLNSAIGSDCQLKVSGKTYLCKVANALIDKPIPFEPSLLTPPPKANQSTGDFAQRVEQLKNQNFQQFNQFDMNQKAINYVNTTNK